MKRFRVTFSVEVEIVVSEELLASVLTDEWRKDHYSFIVDEADVAEHLAFNLARGSGLTSLDGFADQPEGAAVVVNSTWDVDGVEECGAVSPDHGGDW